MVATAPARILVAEDEPILAITLQDILEELGHQVVGPAMRAAEALRFAEREPLEAAILDVNMGDGDSYPAAAALRHRAIPYVFATGYGREGMEPGHDGTLVLQKPYRPSQVAAALAAILT